MNALLRRTHRRASTRVVMFSVLTACTAIPLLSQCSPSIPQDKTIKIMPLGDSITESSEGHASYRYYLWQHLMESGHRVDFVGSQHGVSGRKLRHDDFDQDHEAHSGWRADEILVNLKGWATSTQPDIVLIHLGHNDLWQGESVTSTVEDLSAIIDTLRQVNPKVKILLAQIIPSTLPKFNTITTLNQEIAKLASTKTMIQSPVALVDQFTGFNPSSETWDGVHPNDSGEVRMADKWNVVLESVLDTVF